MTVIESIRKNYAGYRKLAERAIEQMSDADLTRQVPDGGNSVAVICWHVSGNLQSRFTDFLTADGEKPWRNRDEEFHQRTVTRAELLAKWEAGWQALRATLEELTDDHLGRNVIIRGETMAVHEALHRSLTHTAYHVGQIVYLGKIFRGRDWTYLSIPPGGSHAYNAKVKAESHTAGR